MASNAQKTVLSGVQMAGEMEPVINPPKKTEPVLWSEDALIIIIAEGE
jgi:hypothetical protein